MGIVKAAVSPAPTFTLPDPPRSARNPFRDPGFQRFDVAGEGAGTHQADAEDVGIEHEAARLGFLFPDAAGEEQAAGAGQALGVDFLDDGRRLRVAARPVAHGGFDGNALAVARGGIDFDGVEQGRGLAAGLGLGLLADVADAAVLPEPQHGILQVAPVLEMPVEAALGHAEALGEDFHAQAFRAVFGKDGDRRLDPGVAIQHDADGFCGLLFHTVGY